MSPNPIPLDGLLRHANGLRALAHGLLSDEHAAEDVVQDTWIAALERPPQDQKAVGGWLRQVTRRLALKRHRGEGRRTEREERVSRAEALASVDEVAEQRDVLRNVVNAVLDLEEPYQSVVIMRFYQDLAPREIARKRGVPVATVKSQLHRAQEKLRGRLDADAGGSRGQWALALASVTNWHPVAPIVTGTDGASSGAGSSLIKGLTMEWKMALGVATLATVVLTVAELSPASEISGADEGAVALSEPSAPLRTAEPSTDASTPPVGLTAQGGASRERVTVANAAAKPATKLVSGLPLPEHVFALEVVVVDSNDRPVAGKEISLGPRFAPLSSWGETDAEGRFSATWRGHAPTMELALALAGSAGRTGMLALDLTADRPASVRLALRDEGSYSIRGPADSAPDTAELRRSEETAENEARGSFERIELAHVVRMDVSFGSDSGAFSLHQSEPAPSFRWPASRLHNGFVVADISQLLLFEERVAFGNTVLDGFEFELHEEADVELLEGPVGDGTTVLISGVMRDAAGQPVALPIRLRQRDATGEIVSELIVGSDAADEIGAFRLQLPREQVELFVGGGDRGQAVLALDLAGNDAPGEVRWNPTLDRGEEIIGRLLDADGQPLSSWIVEFVVDDFNSPWHDTTVTKHDGTFAIPNVPAHAGRLIFRRDGMGIPVRDEDGIWPGPAPREVRLTTDELGYGALRIEVATPDGEALQEAELRLWRPDAKRGLRLNSADLADGLNDLPAGRYQVVVGSVENGFVDLGGVDIHAGQHTDLGTVMLAEPGRLTWASLGEQAPLGWMLLRRGSEVDMLVAQGRASDAFEADVPAGEYGLILASDDVAAPMIPVTVEAGITTESRVSLAELRRLTLSFELPEGAAEAVTFSIVDAATELGMYASELESGTAGRLFLPEGQYLLRARSGDLATDMAFTVSGADDALSVALR